MPLAGSVVVAGKASRVVQYGFKAQTQIQLLFIY